jgi:hypothetical protein
MAFVKPIPRCQLTRSVEQKCCGSRRTSRPRVVCRLLEHRRDGLVGLVDRRCELPRPRFWIFKKLREPAVDLASPDRIGGLVGAGGEEWVREPDSLAVELDDPSLQRRRQAELTPDSGGRLSEGDRRMRVSSRREEVVATLVRKRE